jgi:hypothetical protein
MKKAIGWQKYEDHLDKQVSSPFLQNIMMKIMSNRLVDEEESGEEEEEDGDIINDSHQNIMMPISPQLLNDIQVISTFDCWIGHTNFDITNLIKDKLNKVDGIELLKIYSRYRFLIGVGHMFNFKEVRKSIEKTLLEE